MRRDRQLALPLAEDAGAGPRPRAALGAALFSWLPLAALFALFCQVALLGLKPALAERDRLDAQELVVVERERRLAEESALHLRRRAALADPVFRERFRRARRSAAFATPPRPLDLPLSDAR